MVLAEHAGIKVFATGGLGGVHRNGENTLDVSADLIDLGRVKMAVVSSGCKSFLDIPRTLEYLETQGVGVCTFADGRPDRVQFPAFWSRESGILSPVTTTDEREAASVACKLQVLISIPQRPGIDAGGLQMRNSIFLVDLAFYSQIPYRRSKAYQRLRWMQLLTKRYRTPRRARQQATKIPHSF